MQHNHDYLNDLKQIRSIMERSSKFHLLSGWAGISAGFLALIGAYSAQSVLGFNPDSLGYVYKEPIWPLLLTAIMTFFSALVLAIFFSNQKAKKQHISLWNSSTKRMFFILLFPLITGGVFSVILLFHGFHGLLAPVLLVFYGLALIAGSPFTLKEVGYLGSSHVILGLFNAWLPQYGLLFWIAGFGVTHIIYGIYMHIKYDREN